MAFVSERVNENAQKCYDCAFKIMRGKLKHKIDKNSVLYREAEVAVESILRVSCNMCPNKDDFVKVYGMPPYDFFAEEDKAKGEKK